MKTQKWHLKYLEWFSADEVHETSKNWNSELNFIKDEQHFFEGLFNQFALSFIKSKEIFTINRILQELAELKKERDTLIWMVSKHIHNLTLLLDDVNQIKEEKLYKETHHELYKAISNFQRKHKALKKNLFKLVSKNLKLNKKEQILFLNS